MRKYILASVVMTMLCAVMSAKAQGWPTLPNELKFAVLRNVTSRADQNSLRLVSRAMYRLQGDLQGPRHGHKSIHLKKPQYLSDLSEHLVQVLFKGKELGRSASSVRSITNELSRIPDQQVACMVVADFLKVLSERSQSRGEGQKVLDSPLLERVLTPCLPGMIHVLLGARAEKLNFITIFVSLNEGLRSLKLTGLGPYAQTIIPLLGQLPSLVSLDVFEQDLMDDDVQCIARHCTRLTRLNLASNWNSYKHDRQNEISNASLQALCAMPCLVDLNVAKRSLGLRIKKEDRGPAKIDDMSSDGVCHLPKLTRLTRLNLECWGVRMSEIEGFSALVSLTNVNLRGNFVDLEAIKMLRVLTRLTCLNLGALAEIFMSRMSTERVAPLSLGMAQELSTMPLQELDLSNNEMNLNVIRVLATSPYISRLSLRSAELGLEAVQELSKMTILTALDLGSKNPIGPEGVGYLVGPEES